MTLVALSKKPAKILLYAWAWVSLTTIHLATCLHVFKILVKY